MQDKKLLPFRVNSYFLNFNCSIVIFFSENAASIQLFPADGTGSTNLSRMSYGTHARGN